jgi:hypothetical protein
MALPPRARCPHLPRRSFRNSSKRKKLKLITILYQKCLQLPEVPLKVNNLGRKISKFQVMNPQGSIKTQSKKLVITVIISKTQKVL